MHGLISCGISRLDHKCFILGTRPSHRSRASRSESALFPILKSSQNSVTNIADGSCTPHIRSPSTSPHSAVSHCHCQRPPAPNINVSCSWTSCTLLQSGDQCLYQAANIPVNKQMIIRQGNDVLTSMKLSNTTRSTDQPNSLLADRFAYSIAFVDRSFRNIYNGFV